MKQKFYSIKINSNVNKILCLRIKFFQKHRQFQFFQLKLIQMSIKFYDCESIFFKNIDNSSFVK